MSELQTGNTAKIDLSSLHVVEVHRTTFACPKDEHKFFALELIGNEPTSKAIITLACTMCGTLVLHRVKI